MYLIKGGTNLAINESITHIIHTRIQNPTGKTVHREVTPKN